MSAGARAHAWARRGICRRAAGPRRERGGGGERPVEADREAWKTHGEVSLVPLLSRGDSTPPSCARSSFAKLARSRPPLAAAGVHRPSRPRHVTGPSPSGLVVSRWRCPLAPKPAARSELRRSPSRRSRPAVWSADSALFSLGMAAERPRPLRAARHHRQSVPRSEVRQGSGSYEVMQVAGSCWVVGSWARVEHTGHGCYGSRPKGTGLRSSRCLQPAYSVVEPSLVFSRLPST